MAGTVNDCGGSGTASSITERILRDRARIRAFVLEHSRLGADETAELLGDYGAGGESEREKELLPIVNQVQKQSINDFLIDYAAWTGSAPIRGAFKAVCGESTSPKVTELRDALNYICYYKRVKDSTAAAASGSPNMSAPWSCPLETLYDIANTLLFTFADIPLLRTDDMRILLENTDIQVAAMALKSERAEMMEKFTSAMTESCASMLMEDMEFMGPCRMNDVIAAQNEISLAIEHLIESGKIKLPSDPVAETGAQCDEAVCCDDASPNSEWFDGFTPPQAATHQPKTEDIFRSVIDYAVTIRSGIRAFILKEAEEKQDAALLQEVQRILSMYSEEGDRRAAERLWSKKCEAMLGRIYSVSMKGEDGKLCRLLCCVPRAATQKALDELAEEDEGLRTVIHGSVLWWDDLMLRSNPVAECADVRVAECAEGVYRGNRGIRVSPTAIREVMRHCTAPVIARSLVGATSEVRDYMLTSMFLCDNTAIPSTACEHWARNVVRREMEGLVDEASRHATAEEVEAARDEVLDAITGT